MHRDIVNQVILQHLDNDTKHIIKTIVDHIDHHPDLKQERELLNSILAMGECTSAITLAFYMPILQVFPIVARALLLLDSILVHINLAVT